MNKNLQNKMKRYSMNIFLLAVIGAIFASTTVDAKETASSSSTAITQENSAKVTLNFKNVPLIKVLDEIQKQSKTGYVFSAMVSPQAIGLVTINVKNVTVKEAMNTLLMNKNYSWTMNAGKIFIDIQRTTTGQQNQPISISGVVLNDGTNEPLPGTTILVVGTSKGSISDPNGKFTINAMVGQTLEFVYLGFKSQFVQITPQMKNMTIKLSESSLKVNDVVVVAYGTQNKREITGAIESVTADQLKEVPSSSLANLLQGKVSGMSVVNTSGAPGGGGTTVTIRGFNSLSIEGERRLSEPLWVIDGVPVPNFTSPVTGTNAMADIDPNMIESVEILKDAASASIYGSRAANGVILVTTKKGSEIKPSFSVNYSESWSINPVTPTLTGGALERRFRDEQLRNFATGYRVTNPDGSYSYTTPSSYDDVYGGGKGNYDLFWNIGNGLDVPIIQDSLNAFYNNSTNWIKEFMQVGKVRNANIQIGGGGDKVLYFVGMGYYDETGVMVGTDFSRFNFSGNFTLHPIKGTVIDSRTYLAYTDRAKARTGYAGSELFDIEPFRTSTLLPSSGSAVFSEYMKRRDDIKQDNYDYKIRSNNSFSYTILKNLEISASLGIDFWQNMMNYFRPSYLGTVRQDGSQESYVSGTIGRSLTLLNENLIKYGFSLGTHSRFNLLLGQSSQIDQNDRIQGVAVGGSSDFIHYATVGFPEVGYQDDGITARGTQSYSSSMARKTLVSWFGRLNYVLFDRYLLSFTYRRDGSSTFGDNNKWGTFPSLSAGWIFTEESFLRNAGLHNIMNFGKLRASAGKSGLQFSSPYLAYGVMVPQTDLFMGQATLAPEWKEGAPNPSLKWEETTQYDLGLDLQFLGNRISFTFDAYSRITEDMLAPISLVGSGSFNPYQKQWQNACAISNSGVEVKVEADLISRKDFTWSISVNYARNWNKFLNSIGRRDFASSGSNISIVGKPLHQLYVLKYMGIYNSDSEVPEYDYIRERYFYKLYGGAMATNIYRAGDPKYLDVNQDGKITSADRVYAGSPLPKASGGITTSIKYKKFDVNCLFAYTLGRTILNASLGTSFELDVNDPTMVHVAHPILADVKDYNFWSPGNLSANMPMIQADAGRAVFSNATTRDIKTINFLKLKTIVVGYTLDKLFKNSNIGMRFYVSGENLFTLSNYKGRDPETIDLSKGIDSSQAYPLATKVTLGATINF